jgi:pyruvate dehydrogenase E1 component
VGTPSGITLGPEGGAHQSIAQPLIGMAQDGLAAFEPAFVDELAVILRFAFDHIQMDGDGTASERNSLRDETGGSVYLRLSTRPVEQIKRVMTPEPRQTMIDGAYWLREPGPNCQVVVAYTGAIAPEAIPGHRVDGRGPSGRGPPRRHVSGSAQRRLDRRATRAQTRACACATFIGTTE